MNISQVIAGISVFFICVSVISFCLKTLPGLRVEIQSTATASVPINSTSTNLSDIYQVETTSSSTTANLTASSTTRDFFNRYTVNVNQTKYWEIFHEIYLFTSFLIKFEVLSLFYPMSSTQKFYTTMLTFHQQIYVCCS
jgi:hypothetical protein